MRRYPGRSFVTTNGEASEMAFRQLTRAPSGLPCTSPVEVHGIGLPDPLIGKQGTVPVTLFGRCRKCDNCLLHRRRLWTARAVDEIRLANRTWFGTLTIAPSERFRISVAADLRVRDSESSEAADERFKFLVQHLNKDVTKMIKRLREHCEPRALRYLIVSERHEDGFPHFHLFIHEHGKTLPKRLLHENWPMGFSSWKLVDRADGRAAFYACKYLSKCALTRVRASTTYGQGGAAALITARVQSLARGFADLSAGQKLHENKTTTNTPSMIKENIKTRETSPF